MHNSGAVTRKSSRGIPPTPHNRPGSVQWGYPCLGWSGTAFPVGRTSDRTGVPITVAKWIFFWDKKLCLFIFVITVVSFLWMRNNHVGTGKHHNTVIAITCITPVINPISKYVIFVILAKSRVTFVG